MTVHALPRGLYTQALQIAALLAFTVAASAGAAWLGVLILSPVGAVGLAITLSVGLAYINLWVNEQIVEINI